MAAGTVHVSVPARAGQTRCNITLTFTRVPRRVDVADASGDITLVLPRGPTYYHVEASSESGITSVSVNRRQSSSYVIIASNGSGDITIRY
jgi:Putative adhesin